MVSLRDAWLQAEREQETGYPNGNYGYNQPGCYGAYCWNAPSNWSGDARQTGFGQYANSLPARVPHSVQDAVAWAIMEPYVTRGQYAQAAELWNGGVPYSVPNPVLGSSAVYANQVISKFRAIMGGQVPAQSSNLAQAQTTGFNPLNPFGSIGSSLFNGLLSALGLSSLKDLFIRLGLILLGGILVLLGIFILVGRSGTQTAVTAAVPGSKIIE